VPSLDLHDVACSTRASSLGKPGFSCTGWCSASTEMPVRHQPKSAFGFVGNQRSAWSEMAVRFRPSYTTWIAKWAGSVHAVIRRRFRVTLLLFGYRLRWPPRALDRMEALRRLAERWARNRGPPFAVSTDVRVRGLKLGALTPRMFRGLDPGHWLTLPSRLTVAQFSSTARVARSRVDDRCGIEELIIVSDPDLRVLHQVDSHLDVYVRQRL